MPNTGKADSANWSQATPIPIKTQEIYPVVHKGKLFVAGGIASRLGVPYFPDATFAYDPTHDSWQEQPELPEALHHIALVSDAESLFGIGGFNGGYSHVWRMRDQVYRLQDSEWLPHSTLPTAQAEGVATDHNGRIYIVRPTTQGGSKLRSQRPHGRRPALGT